jgi:hypothetical protein
MRRLRGRETAEPFGAGSSVWHGYEGSAQAVIIAGRDRMLWAIELADEFVYVREVELAGVREQRPLRKRQAGRRWS